MEPRLSAYSLKSLERAVALHDGVPVPFERSRTLLAFGAALRRSGQRAAARVPLEEARAGFEHLGARPFVARACDELDRLGTRRQAHDGVLTETEQRVAQLAVRGKTNAEIAAELFLSIRTVEANLTRIYRKYGVRSRTELVARARTSPVP